MCIRYIYIYILSFVSQFLNYFENSQITIYIMCKQFYSAYSISFAYTHTGSSTLDYCYYIVEQKFCVSIIYMYVYTYGTASFRNNQLKQLYTYINIFPPRYGSLHPSFVMCTVLFEYK